MSAKKTIKSTQAYLDIAAVKDGVVVLKNGGLRAIVMVTSVNFALKSPAEQEDIVLRYQGFLNALAFPLQIIMQSRKLDLTNYLARLRERGESETNEQIRLQTTSYVAFMEKLLTVANIMDKRFLVVISFDPPSLASRSFFDRLLNPTRQVTLTMSDKEFTEFKTQLDERVGVISSGLASMGLKVGRLGTKELIELYYATYNPEEAVKERLVDVTQLQQQFIGDEPQAQAAVKPAVSPQQPPAPAQGATNG